MSSTRRATISKAIVLDMDGCLVDFYSVKGWLNCLIAEDATPYAVAEPYGDSKAINAALATLQGMGYVVEVVSWLSKGKPSKTFNAAVRKAKLNWLSKHYPSINPSNVHIVAHGTNKWRVSNNKGGVLFDDEQGNIDTWNKHSNSGIGIQVTNRDTILTALHQIIDASPQSGLPACFASWKETKALAV